MWCARVIPSNLIQSFGSYSRLRICGSKRPFKTTLILVLSPSQVFTNNAFSELKVFSSTHLASVSSFLCSQNTYVRAIRESHPAGTIPWRNDMSTNQRERGFRCGREILTVTSGGWMSPILLEHGVSRRQLGCRPVPSLSIMKPPPIVPSSSPDFIAMLLNGINVLSNVKENRPALPQTRRNSTSRKTRIPLVTSSHKSAALAMSELPYQK